MKRQQDLALALGAFLVLFSVPAPALAEGQPNVPLPASAPLAVGAPLAFGTADDSQKITQESSNPMGKLWMMTNQFNMSLPEQDSSKPQYNWNFQPVMTFNLENHLRLITRPVIPVYNAPYGGPLGMEDHRVGLGDIEFLAKLSLAKDEATGFMWGAGPSFVFPSATDRALGSGKWQVGGVAAAAYMDEKWVVGVFPQQRWSVAGDPDRKDVVQTKGIYFIWYSPAPTWQVGMSPTVLVDWKQDEARNAVTLPVGLGLAKLFKIDERPLKISFETDYSVIRPDNRPGADWTFHLNLTPIIRPFF